MNERDLLQIDGIRREADSLIGGVSHFRAQKDYDLGRAEHYWTGIISAGAHHVDFRFDDKSRALSLGEFSHRVLSPAVSMLKALA